MDTSKRPQGIDVSSHNPDLDWGKIRAAGIDFAFIKVTQGNGYRNPEFDKQWAGAKAQGILRGAYHFWRWDVDPTEQAQWFIKNVPSGDAGELPFVVDVEGPGDGPGTDGGGTKDYGAAEAVLRLRTYIATIKRGTGKTPMIYTYPGVWREVMADSKAFADCPLWIARYKVPQPDIPGGWQTYTFWQYTSSGYIDGAGEVDCDVFNGTLDQLKALLGTDPTVQYFPQTGQYVAHGFLDYYRKYGTMRNFGYPLTGEFTQTLEDGQDWTVQYFERGVLSYRPDRGVVEARDGYMLAKALGYIK